MGFKKSQGKKSIFRRKRKFYDIYTKMSLVADGMGNMGICGEKMWIMWTTWCITVFSTNYGIS
jgi:hypothetical protein